MPIEFSAAAFRFGHTMVRAAYEFNLNFNRSGQPGTCRQRSACCSRSPRCSGEFGGDSDTLPDNWIVEWERLIGDGAGR